MSSSSHFQSEPLPLILVRVLGLLPGLCLLYYRPPNSIRHGLLSFVTLLHPTPPCPLVPLPPTLKPQHKGSTLLKVNGDGDAAGPFIFLSQVLSFLSQESP